MTMHMCKESTKTDITEIIQKAALKEGAALIGFAPVERYATLPKECGPQPQEVFPGAKTVISFAVQMR